MRQVGVALDHPDGRLVYDFLWLKDGVHVGGDPP
jgi:hypothetical protein